LPRFRSVMSTSERWSSQLWIAMLASSVLGCVLAICLCIAAATLSPIIRLRSAELLMPCRLCTPQISRRDARWCVNLSMNGPSCYLFVVFLRHAQYYKRVDLKHFN
jgi:hypothetical protein